MQLFLTRHGEMETYDPEKSLRNHGISSLGVVQSIFLGEQLAKRVDEPTLYTGPSERHLETANLVSDTFESLGGGHVDKIVVEEFDDARWGSEAILSAGERSLNQREWIDALVKGELPIDEPFPEVRERVLGGLSEIREGKTGPVVVVTSLVVVLIIASEVLDVMLEPPQIHADNACITELNLMDKKDIVVQLNSTGHLPGGSVTDSWSEY